MRYQYVRLERQGPVALVTMNNPATANAMDEDLGPELVRTLEDLSLDKQARALVLTGAGGVFSAGGNVVRAYEYLEARPGAGASPVFEGYTKWVSRAIAALTTMPQPVVAAVNGAASGAGFAWMLASDLVVAAQDAKILPGFLAIGLAPAAGMTTGLTRLLGHLRAAEILMLNRPLDPQEALGLGVVDRVAPAGGALPVALELAQGLAQGPREALAATKSLLAAAGRRGLFSQLEDERRAVMAAADQPDFRERAGRFVHSRQRRPSAS